MKRGNHRWLTLTLLRSCHPGHIKSRVEIGIRGSERLHWREILKLEVRESHPGLECGGQRPFGFPPGAVLVVRVLLHVQRAESLSLVDEGPLIHLRQKLPFGPQPFGNLRVVHFGVLECDFAALDAGPHHESVHGALDVSVGLGTGGLLTAKVFHHAGEGI